MILSSVLGVPSMPILSRDVDVLSTPRIRFDRFLGSPNGLLRALGVGFSIGGLEGVCIGGGMTRVENLRKIRENGRSLETTMVEKNGWKRIILRVPLLFVVERETHRKTVAPLWAGVPSKETYAYDWYPSGSPAEVQKENSGSSVDPLG